MTAYRTILAESEPTSLTPNATLELADLERAAAELSSALFPPELAARLAGVPAVEIATALDLSASTVRVHLARARRRLRELLAAELDEEVSS